MNLLHYLEFQILIIAKAELTGGIKVNANKLTLTEDNLTLVSEYYSTNNEVLDPTSYNSGDVWRILS